MSSDQKIDVVPMAPNVGAEMRGLNVAQLDDAGFERMREALHVYGVIYLRNQDITPQQQVDFALRWGEINKNRFFKASDQALAIRLFTADRRHLNTTSRRVHE